MPNTYTELQRTVLGTATSTVTLSSIPSGYTDLVLVCSAKSTTGTPTIRLQFNSDTGSNYSATIVYGDGSGAGSLRVSNQASINQGVCTTEFGTTQIHLMNYSNATTNKTTLCDYRNIGPTYGEAGAIVGLWRNTAAITSITIFPASSTFAVGSTFSLYGIANADLGAAKATGGIITEDANYWYHTFGASGAFIPKQSLTCDYLVVAGGGGSGGAIAQNYSGSGGGAGGLRAFTSQSLSATSYAVTVGAGGAGVTALNAAATVGSNTTFNSTSVTGGGKGSNQGAGSWTSGGSGAGATADGGSSSGPGAAGASGNAGGYSPVEGYAGGTGWYAGANRVPSGGGGGAGGAGGNAADSVGGNGGAGANTYNSINFSTWLTATSTGVSGLIAGGGGGGSRSGGTAGSAGSGGGAAGSVASSTTVSVAGNNATANTGGGGGGGGPASSGTDDKAGGNGGSGIVIIRYAK
jgi:hypothetical protein